MYIKKQGWQPIHTRSTRQIKAQKHKPLKNINNKDTTNTQMK